jgi:hypothetical protein
MIRHFVTETAGKMTTKVYRPTAKTNGKWREKEVALMFCMSIDTQTN